jgi:RNA polymerase sigma-70 factor
MNNNIDIKTLEAFQDGNHKAFETIFIAYYNKTKTFIDGYIKSEPDAEELTEDLSSICIFLIIRATNMRFFISGCFSSKQKN